MLDTLRQKFIHSRPLLSAEEFCFLSLLDLILFEAEKKKQKLFRTLREKKSITVVDVGSGYFRYGHALLQAMQKINPQVKLYATDLERKRFRYNPALFVKGDVTTKGNRFGTIDIFTVFNPFPGIPEIHRIPIDYRRNALFVGCVDWNKELFKSTLTSNGFTPLVWQKNKYWDEMRAWWNNSDPFVVGVTIQKQ